MSRVQITLYGDDSEWFEEKKQEVAKRRGGNAPSNAEFVRLLLQETDV